MSIDEREVEPSCGDPSTGCCPPSGSSRREFLQILGIGALAAVASPWPVMAGPFEAGDFAKLVPPDKKLAPEWLKSLTARGVPTAYRGAELDKIGMPVGGIGAGQVYLGGDGKLWHWDIFNLPRPTGDAHYANPPKAESPFDQGFALRVVAEGHSTIKPLDHRGFADITFRGQYPIGLVEYRDAQLPVQVDLEAFSPFIPLDADDSSLPATILNYTVKNTGNAPVEAEIAGWLENAICQGPAAPAGIVRRNQVFGRAGLTTLECSAEPVEAPEDARKPARADIAFEDFEKGTYEGWTVNGTAFGKTPIAKAEMPAYQGDVGSKGKRLVNSHNARQGEDVARGDAHTGMLTSKEFHIDRDYVNLLIGGGSHAGKTCVNVLVDNKAVLSATGHDDNKMRPASLDVRPWHGKAARLQIVDDDPGAWGNIGVDEIVFSDRPAVMPPKPEDRPDFGTMALAILGDRDVRSTAALPDEGIPPGVFPPADDQPADATRLIGRKLMGTVARKVKLKPGESETITFIVAWHFPNLRLDGLEAGGRWYATKFRSAGEVALDVSIGLGHLERQTRLWRDTWYDSTLPYWFLDRTLLNASILATSTCYRFGNGRFYGWEGVGCCVGTCTHVWHYAQAVARLFPTLERDTRERVDLGIAFDLKTGIIDHRGEFRAGEAVDGQAGTVLRCYREHQMSADDAFLKRNWPKIKQALGALIAKDGDGDGILEGPQHNTLDSAWFGKVPWLSALYHAALRAGEEMAIEMRDNKFAAQCRLIFEAGRKRLDALTWKEAYGYYIQVPDPRNLDAVGSFDGCEIDQVLGQSWAHQVGLGAVMDPAHSRKALESLWKYNFTPDVGPYRKAHQAGRWYAMAGEGGLLMATHPFGPGKEFKDHPSAWAAMYFNECMTGFEHQVAGHMIAEGMVTEGLAIQRTIHDRYHASRRNPWNEVECGDHYARAMASYGVFLTACGFEHHGPKGSLAFAPRISPEDFRAAFTVAEGWGTFSQRLDGGRQHAMIALKSGRLRLKSLTLTYAGEQKPTGATIEKIAAKVTIEGKRVKLAIEPEVTLKAGGTMVVVIEAGEK